MDDRWKFQPWYIKGLPILAGDMVALAKWIEEISPEFVNIGADSKGTGLDEPSAEEVQLLIDELQARGVEIRQKRNLERLIGGSNARRNSTNAGTK